MLYQCENGKVIYLSAEDYFSMSDRDLHELANSGYGDDPSPNMYYGKKAKEIAPPVDKQADIDYTPESEDTDTQGPIDIHSLPDE